MSALIALVVLVSSTSAYAYTRINQTQIQLRISLNHLIELSNVESISVTKAVSGMRSANIDQFDEAQVGPDELQYLTNFAYQDNQVVRSTLDGREQVLPKEQWESILGIGSIDQWDAIINSQDINGQVNIVKLSNIGVVDENFQALLEQELRQDLEQTFSDFEVVDVQARFEGGFSASLMLENSQLSSITFISNGPIEYSFSLGTSSNIVEELTGKLEYDNLEIRYDIESLEFNPQIPQNVLLQKVYLELF